MSRPRFHLAFPVHDLVAARGFYEGVLGAQLGRTHPRWIDFDFWGHQITAHCVQPGPSSPEVATTAVDHKVVPVRHFGLILEVAEWEDLRSRLEVAEVPFLLEPNQRFAGLPGEQFTMFVEDPSGNALEFKSFRDMGQIFASQQ